MGLDLVQYLSDRQKQADRPCHEPGPVVTISREMGCPGTQITELLVNELNSRFELKGPEQWKWAGKEEIQRAAAHKLNLPTEEISYVFDAKKKKMAEEILQSMSYRYYKSDRRIRNTVKSVIRTIACEGHVVILGRGGVAITRDLARSLHIHLEAPLEWRTLRISEKFQFDLKAAERYVKEIDRKREEFRTYFGGKGTDYLRFDLTFNCMTLSVKEIVEIIIKTMEIRKFIA
jgi:cytidylate kinase